MRQITGMKTRALAMLLALVLCLSMAGMFAPQAKASSLDGTWQAVKINTKNVHAWVLDEKLYDVTSFDLYMDVTMNNGTSCENWTIWGRRSRGGSFEKIGTIYLPGGNGDASKTVRLLDSFDIEAIALTPAASGNFSWSMYFEISNVECEDSWDALDAWEASADTGSFSGYLDGDWEYVDLDGWNVSAYVLADKLTNATSFDLDVEFEMNYGARCESWNVWIRRSRSGSFEKVGSLFLPGGDGEVYKTIRLPRAMNVDAIVITPVASGNISWTMYLGVCNPVSGSSSASSNASPTYGGYLDGDWEEVTIYDNGRNYDLYAFALYSPMRNCTSFDLDADITMMNNTSCKRWNVWVRSRGNFYKAEELYLPAGKGSITETITLSRARDVDAVVLVPIASGGFSWEISLGIYNPG